MQLADVSCLLSECVFFFFHSVFRCYVSFLKVLTDTQTIRLN